MGKPGRYTPEQEHDLSDIFVAGQPQCCGGRIQGMTLGCIQVIRQSAVVTAGIRPIDHLVAEPSGPSASNDLFQPDSIRRKRIPPIKVVQRNRRVVGNIREVIADRLAGNHFFVSALMDGDIGEDAGVPHLNLDDLPLMLQVDGNRLAVYRIVGRCCYFLHSVPAPKAEA